MHIRLEGRARLLGDDVNTDYIITSTRKRDTLDVSVLTQYLFESVDPKFAASVKPGDLIVAGRNFGCGSAMEIAATVILGAGIRAVVATTFSRTFFRNAINNGFPILVCPGISQAVQTGQQLAVELDAAHITNLATGQVLQATPLSATALEILAAGGLVPYARRKLAQRASATAA